MIERDLKNSLDTAREEGKIEGKIEIIEEVALTMIKNNESDQKIMTYTGLSISAIKT